MKDERMRIYAGLFQAKLRSINHVVSNIFL